MSDTLIPLFAMCCLCEHWEPPNERCSLDGSYRKPKDECSKFERVRPTDEAKR